MPKFKIGGLLKRKTDQKNKALKEINDFQKGKSPKKPAAKSPSRKLTKRK